MNVRVVSSVLEDLALPEVKDKLSSSEISSSQVLEIMEEF